MCFETQLINYCIAPISFEEMWVITSHFANFDCLYSNSTLRMREPIIIMCQRGLYSDFIVIMINILHG